MTTQEFINKWDCIPLIGFEGGYGLMLKDLNWLGYCCYDESTGPSSYQLSYSNHVDITCADTNEYDKYLDYLDECMPNIIRANWLTDELGYPPEHPITKSLLKVSREDYDTKVYKDIKQMEDNYFKNFNTLPNYLCYYEVISVNLIKQFKLEGYKIRFDHLGNTVFEK